MAKKQAAKSPMTVSRAGQPLWVRIVIIVVIVTFVGSAILIGANVISSSKTPTTATGTGTGTDSITAQYQGAAEAAQAAVNASPNDPAVLASAGNTYYDWAATLYEAGQQVAANPLWLAAVSYYDRALAIQPDNANVLGDKALAMYYSNSVGADLALQAFIDMAEGNANLASQVENARGLLADLGSSATTTSP